MPFVHAPAGDCHSTTLSAIARASSVAYHSAAANPSGASPLVCRPPVGGVDSGPGGAPSPEDTGGSARARSADAAR